MEKYVNEFEVGDGIVVGKLCGKVIEVHKDGWRTKLLVNLDNPEKTNWEKSKVWECGFDGVTSFGYFERHDAKRNCFGQLEYRLGDYFVTKHESCEKKYKIKKQTFPWLVNDAAVSLGAFGFWDEPEFDSFIQAARFLKENIGDML